MEKRRARGMGGLGAVALAWLLATSFHCGTSEGGGDEGMAGDLDGAGGELPGGTDATDGDATPPGPACAPEHAEAAWSVAGMLPGPRVSHAAVGAAGHIYLFGGYDGAAVHDEVYYAAVGDDGTLGAWVETTPLVGPAENLAVVVYDGAVYALGGDDTMKPSASVYRAPLLEGGGLGAWQPETSLPLKRFAHAAAIGDRFLFVLGGDKVESGAGDTAVFVTEFEDDGALAKWANANPLPAARKFVGAAAAGGRLFAIGGLDAEGSHATVWSAALTGAGSLGGWQDAPPIEPGIQAAAVVAVADHVYVAGGVDDLQARRSLLVGSPSGGGKLEGWQALADLPATRFRHALVHVGRWLFAMGGWVDANFGDPPQDNVWRIAICQEATAAAE